MFKLPDDIPNIRADISDIVDFYETQCLRSDHGRTSYREIFCAVSSGDDEIEIAGIDDENDFFNNEKFEEVCSEIQRRIQSCGGKYPFYLEDKGYVLKLKPSKEDWEMICYTYLLLATRLNMNTNRVHSGIDGTLLFEKFSAEVAKKYWGERAESLVFGTAKLGGFSTKIDELCNKIGEGSGFKNRNTSAPKEKDAKLDVVVWKSFNDKQQAKLIGFGQCKTGTNWEEHVSQLQPDSFCRSWFESLPAVSPVRLYFICDTFPSTEWYSKASSTGIIFDRLRIMDYLPSTFDGDIGSQVKKWVKAAMAFVKSL